MRNIFDNSKDQAFELLKMLELDLPYDKIAEWMETKGGRYTTAALRNTFRIAGKEELGAEFIKEVDINLGDSIRSRMTSRFGKVIGIHADGDTVEVKWDSGGRQFVSKESLFKMKKSDATTPVENTRAIKKVHTVLDPYGDIKKKD